MSKVIGLGLALLAVASVALLLQLHKQGEDDWKIAIGLCVDALLLGCAIGFII